MNWYTVQRKFRQPNGKLGEYTDFTYALGMRAVRKLCISALEYGKISAPTYIGLMAGSKICLQIIHRLLKIY